VTVDFWGTLLFDGPGSDDRYRPPGNGNLAFFVPFPAHPQPALSHIDIFEVHAHQFADANPATI